MTIDKVQAIPLSDIEIDHSFNARSGDWAKTEDQADGHAGMKGLVESIKARGQDTEVVVMPNTKPLSKTNKPFFLVNGFRRAEAVRLIGEENKDKAVTINAKVRIITPVEARALNVRENSSREDFTAPDLAYGIAKMAESGTTDIAIAAELGLTQSYVSRLHRIYKDTRTSKLFEKWRAAPVQLPTLDMAKVAAQPAEKQAEAYDAAYKKLSKADATEVKWFDRSKSAVEGRARYLGKMVNQSLLGGKGIEKDLGDWTAAVYFFGNMTEAFIEKNKPTQGQIAKLAAHAIKCYEEERDYVEPEVEEVVSPDGKTKKPKKKNGAATAEAN